jgi:surface antigen
LLIGIGCSGLAACQSAQSGVTDASLSAYAPAQQVAAPSLAAGLAGSTIGLELSSKDKRKALNAEYQALEFGRTGVGIVWQGRSGRGQVTAGPPYQVNDYDCRDYTHTITVKKQSETGRATACRGPSGAWQLIG